VYGAAWQRVATNANRFAFAKSDLLVRDFSSGHMDPIYLPMPTGLPQLVIVHEIRSFRIARNKSPFQGMTMAIVCVLVQDTWDADLRPTASNSTLHAEERRKEGKKVKEYSLPSARSAGRRLAANEDEDENEWLGRWVVLGNWAAIARPRQRSDLPRPNRWGRSGPHALHPTVQMTPRPDGK